MDTQFKHFTAAVLPFNILVNKKISRLGSFVPQITGDNKQEVRVDNNPFDMKFNFELLENAADMEEFKHKLSQISTFDSEFKIDSKYHAHVYQMISAADKTNDSGTAANTMPKKDFAFLKVYKVDSKYLFVNKIIKLLDFKLLMQN